MRTSSHHSKFVDADEEGRYYLTYREPCKLLQVLSRLWWVSQSGHSSSSRPSRDRARVHVVLLIRGGYMRLQDPMTTKVQWFETRLFFTHTMWISHIQGGFLLIPDQGWWSSHLIGHCQQEQKEEMDTQWILVLLLRTDTCNFCWQFIYQKKTNGHP